MGDTVPTEAKNTHYQERQNERTNSNGKRRHGASGKIRILPQSLRWLRLNRHYSLGKHATRFPRYHWGRAMRRQCATINDCARGIRITNQALGRDNLTFNFNAHSAKNPKKFKLGFPVDSFVYRVNRPRAFLTMPALCSSTQRFDSTEELRGYPRAGSNLT